MSRIIFFILVLLACIILYLLLFYHTTKKNQYYSNNNNLNYNYPINDNNKSFDLDVDNNNIKGYENEVMYISDDLKDGSYVNQFKEIDYSKMKLTDNQIGFNPEPRCSSGALPFVDVNVNYLLKEK